MAGKTVPIYRGTDGLDNKTDPARLFFDPKTNIRSMSRAVNVVVDDSHRLMRCDGFVEVNTTTKRVWGDGGVPGLAIQNNVLCLLGEGGGLTSVQTLTSPVRLLSAVRWADRIYWTTGNQTGYIQNGQAYNWLKSDFIPEEFSDFAYDSPIVGDILAEFGSRMIAAAGNAIYHSELNHPHLFRYGYDYIRFFNNISMLAPVSDGVWTSDGERLYWMPGFDPSMWVPFSKGDFGVIPYQSVRVPAINTSYKELSPTGYCWKANTTKGVVTLGANGFIGFDTEDRIETEKSPYPLLSNRGCAGSNGSHVFFGFEP